MRALHTVGWGAQEIAAMSGLSLGHVQHLSMEAAKDKKYVTARTWHGIVTAYRELSGAQGPRLWWWGPRATRRGWLGPAWWDPDTIDDPSYQPPTRDLGRSRGVDEVRVQIACEGVRVPLSATEREAAVTELHRRGLNDTAIAERLWITPRTAHRIRGRLGLPAVAMDPATGHWGVD